MSKTKIIHELTNVLAKALRHKIGSIVNQNEIYAQKYSKDADLLFKEAIKISLKKKWNNYDKNQIKEELKRKLKIELESKEFLNERKFEIMDEEIEKAVMSIVTDSSGERPENVYTIHALLLEKNDLDALYAENKGQYKKLKEALVEDLKQFIGPMRERRQALEEDREAVLEVLKTGGRIARKRAEKKMDEVREKVGLVFK